jgi:hypothetical protein
VSTIKANQQKSIPCYPTILLSELKVKMFICIERAECDSSKYLCRRYLVWSRYEIIWVKGQTRIKNFFYQTLAISFLRTFFVIFKQKTAEVVEK